jgi:hypothetical protein
MHFGRRAGIAESDEAPAPHRIEVGARRGGDVRLFEHAFGEIEAVVAKPLDVDIEIEAAVDRQHAIEARLRQAVE